MTSICTKITPRLPRKPLDAATICDEQSNVWQFGAAESSWLETSSSKAIPDANFTTDGLVTPEVYQQIQQLRIDVSGGIPPTLKLLPNTGVNYYLFLSSDGLIKFTPEGPSDLRLEVDRVRLWRIISRLACRGPKGLQGDPGDPGKDGILTVEANYEVGSDYRTGITADGLSIFFSLTVETPINTPISIRLFDSPPADASDVGASVVVLAPVGPGTPSVAVLDQTVNLDVAKTIASLHYDKGKLLLTGSLVLASGSWVGHPWFLRARQKGPVGDKGDDVTCGIPIIVAMLPKGPLKATCPLIQLRQSPNTPNTLLSYCTDLFVSSCMQAIRFPVLPSQIAPGSIVDTNGRLAAAKPQVNNCRDNVIWQFVKPSLRQPDLFLPAYTPSPGCQDADSGANTMLNWVPNTDVGPSGGNWANPNSPGATNQMFPWQILQDPPPSGPNCDPCAGVQSLLAEVLGA